MQRPFCNQTLDRLFLRGVVHGERRPIPATVRNKKKGHPFIPGTLS
jgi:hypothetical protein